MPRLRAFGGALLILALLLGLLEGAARLIPFDRLEPAFAGPRTARIFIPGTGRFSDRMVTNDHFRGVLRWQAFSKVKAPGTRRVFVLGGSAALGWPWLERNGWTGYLRRALATVAPGGFEIVNVGGMSYGSHRVLDLLREIVERYEPDLVVVWCGNNEYVERNVLPPAPPGGAAGRARTALRRTGIYRAVRLALHHAAPGRFTPTPDGDLTDLRAPVERGRLGRTAAGDREVIANYRRNLEAGADELSRRGVPAIFVTVPVNLADWAPEPSQPEIEDAGLRRRWSELFTAAWRGAIALPPRPDVAAAAEALSIAPRHPATLFWYGKTMLAAGEPAARPALLAARDGDPRVIRALGSFNEIVRGLAAGRSGISVFDLDRAFADRSPGGAPGENLFVDYVHPNERGQRLTAALLAGEIARASGRLLPLDRVEAVIAADAGPGPDAPDRAEVAYCLGMMHRQLGRLEEAERDYRETLALAPNFPEAITNLAEIRAERGDRAEAASLYERALRVSPENSQVLLTYGLFLLDAGETRRAERLLRDLVALNPLNPSAHRGLGEIALGRGAPYEAAEHFARAAALGEDSSALHRAWGDAEYALGRPAQALERWKRGLTLDPFDDGLRERRARLLREGSP